MNIRITTVKRNFMISGVFVTLFINMNLFAQQIFKDSGQQLGNSFSWNVALGDLDGDGDLDAAVANPFYSDDKPQKNEIWLNDGKGYFSKSSQEIGSCYGLTLFDIDMDKDLDLIEGTNKDTYRSSNKVWLNDGKANFTLSGNYNFKFGFIAFDNKMQKDDFFRAISMERLENELGDSTILRIYILDNSSCKLEREIILKDI